MGNKQILERYAKWLRLRRQNNERTIKNSIHLTTLFFRWLEKNDVNIDDIYQNVIDEYLYTCDQHYAKNSLVPISINLKKFVEFLGKDIRIHIARVKAPNRDKTALTKKEIKEMFRVVESNPLDSAILKTLYYTAMRKSELINLDIDDIDFDRLLITIRHGKGDRRMVVNITKDGATAIQGWLKERPKPKEGHEKALFISSYKQRVNGFYIWNLVKRTAAMAGI